MTKIIFIKDNPYELPQIIVAASYNMTKSYLFNRNPDMEVKLQNGNRMILKKQFIAGIEEILAVKKTAESKKEEVKPDENPSN